MSSLTVWQSFWDLASPEESAQDMRDLFGDEAPQAAEGCARAARFDNREEDFLFWTAVLAFLRAAPHSQV